MKFKKLFSYVFVFVFFAIAFVSNTKNASAYTVYPSGCSSAIGYSITTGSPCNGTSSATLALAGCPTVLGFSTVNGVACSGSAEALVYLNGCSALYGYSTITAAPCNGTAFAALPPGTNPVPNLPTTDLGGSVLSNMLIVSSSILGLMGIVYVAFSKKSKLTV